VSIGIQYRGGTLNFWKDGFELQVTIPEEGSVKEYLLQVVFRCYEDDKYFNVFINTKNTSKGSSVVFDALQAIKAIIDKFHKDTTANKEIHIGLEEYGLHPEHIDYEPLSIAKIKEEYGLPDRILHVNNNPYYFGVENCSTDEINSFQRYYIANEKVIESVRRESEQIDDDSAPLQTKPLLELSVDDVNSLLESLNLRNYCAIFQENAIDGPTLMNCKSVDDVKELGINLTPKASVLYEEIVKFKSTGVPLILLSEVSNYRCFLSS
jgi:hypothetical protein